MKQHYLRVSAVALPLTFVVIAAMFYSTAVRNAAAKADQPKTAKPQAVAKGGGPKTIKRVGSVIGLNEETMKEYIILHEHVWPEILQKIRESNIRNYSIFVAQLDDGKHYLFSYFEYVGDDFDADMAAIGADPDMRDWWKLTDPLQTRIQGTPVGDQWKTMKQVFYTD